MTYPDAENSENPSPQPKSRGGLAFALVAVLWVGLGFGVKYAWAVCTPYWSSYGITFTNGQQASNATNSNYDYWNYCNVYIPTNGDYTPVSNLTWTLTTQSSYFKENWNCSYNGRWDFYFTINCTWSSNVTAFWESDSTPPSCTLTPSPSTVNLGDSSTLTANCTPAATSYAWTNTSFASTAFTGSVSPTATTNYTVKGTNASGPGNLAQATVTVNPLSDVTNGTRVNASALSLNRATGKYTGTLTVTNTTGSTITGPLYVFFTLPAGVTLPSLPTYNGLPYAEFSITGGLAGGATTASTSISFIDPSNARIAYTTTQSVSVTN